ncbi:hypothetical protein P7C71_g4374, partial [Lecanoromycetidae sp. Uapishka_2]
MADVTPAKRKFGDISTVTLYVGATKIRFQVHEDLLCEASSFFNTAFHSHFKEGAEKEMTLPEDDAELFDVFVQWLYHQHYEIPASDLGRGYLLQTMRLYILADKYQITKFKTNIVDTLVIRSKTDKTPPSFIAAHHIYANTPAKSGMRRMIADWYACMSSASWWQQDTTQEWLRKHSDLAVDLIVSWSKHKRLSKKDFPPKDMVDGSGYYDDYDDSSTKSP